MPFCPTCDKELDTEAGVNIHHFNVHNESIALEESICKDCGNEFEYYPSDKKGIYCSNCADNSWGTENLSHESGEDNTNWKGGDVDTFCSYCDEQISVRRCHYNQYQNNFCSKDCEAKFRSKDFSGEGNPRYIDGRHREREYGTGWRKSREEALKRDNYVCQICGKGEEELGRNPAVHHIKPIRKFDDLSKGHKLDNLITLCPKHHQEVEAGNRKI
jgi:5-methylcytosine-specific restriction endonuclease McrA